MNIADIYAHTPGSRFLTSCPYKAPEALLDYIYSSMPAAFKVRTALNSSSVTSMDISPDENPNRFSDLLGLCAKLVSAAGKRSHFEGLLIINISALSPTPDNTIRLKALGELLSMKDGLASQCITLLYGPEKERELLVCADYLDFDGKLKVICYEQENKLSLTDLLNALDEFGSDDDNDDSEDMDTPESVKAELEALFDQLFSSHSETDSSPSLEAEGTGLDDEDDNGGTSSDECAPIDQSLRSMLDDFLKGEESENFE